MSSGTFGVRGSTITIHEDSAENVHAGQRKTKRDDMQGKAPANKRAALGTITNMTRIQPSRVAKQHTAAADAASHVSTCGPASFNVFVDKGLSSPANRGSQARDDLDTVAFSHAHHLDLHHQLTSVRPPLSSLPLDQLEDSSISQDSPMLLDVTVDDRCHDDGMCERAVIVNTVPQYAADIYNYLREAEVRRRARSDYMRKQPDVTASMRSILVDWLVEVCDEYRLHRETLCLSINYIDRFLSQMSVLRGKLQLVGAAAMFIAAKYEEIYPPEVSEFVYITDDTYSKKQVLRMEHLILKVLSFDVAVPTANCFCEKFLLDTQSDEQTKSLAMYFIELSLIEADPFLKYLPSVTAAAAICLANHTLHREPAMPQSLMSSSQYTPADLDECLHDLYLQQVKAASHPQQAVYEKYRKATFQQVALLSPRPLRPAVE